MKKTILSLLVAAFALLFAVAQETDDGKQISDDQAKELQLKVAPGPMDMGLSQEQMEQVNAINMKYANKMMEMHKSETTDKQKMSQEMIVMREQRNNDLKKVLSEEQFAKMNEIQEQQSQTMQQAMNAHNSRGQNQQFKAEAKAYYEKEVLPSLTQQRAKLEEKLSEDEREQLAELRILDAQMKPLMRSMKRDASTLPDDDQMGQMKNYREGLADLQNLKEKYKEDIEKLYQEIMPTMESWKTEFQAIAEKYNKEGKVVSPEYGKTYNGFKHERFLLIDPSGKSVED
ncbi:MAG: hypothetical protein IH946_01190 [Bacteroidetes bacterium]|nr:hypothetical protein [Bacteroidota bacterium]